MTDDDLLQKIWKLTSDLTVQQQTNQDIATSIKSQFHTLKQRRTVVNDKEDFDLDSEDFLPELVPANAVEAHTTSKSQLASVTSKHTRLLEEYNRIKARNQELEKEQTELQDLVKHYESSLELIAGKLRTFSSATAEGQAQLRREYEALLDAEKDTTTTLFMENTILQSQLVKLSAMLRRAYEQEVATPNDSQIHQLMTENEGLRTMLKITNESLSPATPSSPFAANLHHNHRSISSTSPALSVSQVPKPIRTPTQIGKPNRVAMQDYFGEMK